MKTWILLAWIALAGFVPGRSAAGVHAPARQVEKERILVVVNRSNPIDSLTIDQVRHLFLRRDLTWERPLSERKQPLPEAKSDFDPREKVLPIELTRTLEHKAFLEHVLQKDENALERHWIKLEYQHAVMRPKRVGTPDRVIKYTASLKGCIGFVNAKDLDARALEHVKVVFSFDV